MRRSTEAGSGSTALAAMLTGRRCIVVESDARYCDVIRRRVERASGDGPGSLFAGPTATDIQLTLEDGR